MGMSKMIAVEAEVDNLDRSFVYAGLDVGNNDAKLALLVPMAPGGKWNLFLNKIPSRVEFGLVSKYSKNESLDDLIQIIDDEFEYIVGSPNPISTGAANYQFSEARGALAYALLSKTLSKIPKGFDLKKPVPVKAAASMMTGLYYEDGKKAIDKLQFVADAIVGGNFRGPTNLPNIQYKAANTSMKLEVVAETLAASVNFLRKDDGTARDSYDDGETIKPGQRILVVDVGRRDTTILELEVSKNILPIMKDFVSTQEISIEQSLASQLEVYVREIISKEKGKARDLRIPSAMDLLELDEYRIFNKDVDLNPLKQKAIKSMTINLAGFIGKFSGYGNGLTKVYLVGGYAPKAMELLGDDFFSSEFVKKNMSFNNLVVPEFPEYANAKGVLKALLLRL